MSAVDAVVVGSGPNGLAGALTLARRGMKVLVLEASSTPGGGCRTEELTLPGFRHDVCSTVHPLLAASPFFKENPTLQDSVELLSPLGAVAHPLDGDRAAVALLSLDETAEGLGSDASEYRRLLEPFVTDADTILPELLRPLRALPSHPASLARFGRLGVTSIDHLVRRFVTDEARALFAGAAAHSMLPLTSAMSGGYGLVLLLLAHVVGWPVVEGGSEGIVAALMTEIESHGGEVRTDSRVDAIADLPPSRIVLLDLGPRQLLQLGASQLSGRRQRALQAFRYGPGVCKVDWALSGPVPWSASQCRAAGTLHLGGSFEEVRESEADVAAGRHPERPFCIVVQPGIVDASRAPKGASTLWAYCHVPQGSSVDMTARIEAQIERFAPGFSDLVLARATRTASEFEAYNPNYVGGDINGGAATLRQTFFRPTVSWRTYRSGIPGVYLCSASTPPGGGVHGMCGYNAAQAALHELGVATSH